MKITVVIYGVLIGVLAGLFWGTTFGATTATSIKFGALVGAVFGILISFFGKAATMRRNVMQTETEFVNTSILTLIALLGIGTGILVWIIRLIFF